MEHFQVEMMKLDSEKGREAVEVHPLKDWDCHFTHVKFNIYTYN